MKQIILPTAFVLLFGGLVLLGLPEAPLHPCHQGGPGGPGVGPPCPPTPTSIPLSGGDGSQPLGSGAGSVGFEVRNLTSENVTLWLGDPVQYVLNVPAKSESTFTVGRDVYSFDLASCGRVTGGYLNLTIHSFIDIEACETRTLVAVELVNRSAVDLGVQLHGPADYVIPLRSGEARTVTIFRGAYEALLTGCPGPAAIDFSAHAGRTIEIACP